MKKRNLKGMTLMEIVVSMAVYGVLALLMVEIMSCVNGTMRITNQLNKRLAYDCAVLEHVLKIDKIAVMHMLRVIIRVVEVYNTLLVCVNDLLG